jgi:hypothetical protein
MAVWQASNLKKKCAKWPLLSAEGCHTLPDHSVELFAEGRRALKAVKALRGLISRPIQDLRFFLKANVTTRYRKTVVRKSRFS